MDYGKHIEYITLRVDHGMAWSPGVTETTNNRETEETRSNRKHIMNDKNKVSDRQE